MEGFIKMLVSIHNLILIIFWGWNKIKSASGLRSDALFVFEGFFLLFRSSAALSDSISFGAVLSLQETHLQILKWH